MKPSEPRPIVSASNPALKWQAPVQSSEPDDDARLRHLFARACAPERQASELAYGCVDWYLYGAEALSAVGH